MIKRPTPRRPASWYPVGTELTLRDGRKFVVVDRINRYGFDPSYGHGGEIITEVVHYRAWEEVG